MATAEQPLYGYTVLLTRPAESGARLCERLESLGAVVEKRPTIALEPPLERAPVLHALASVESFDWLLFTSPRGVHYFFSLMHEALGSSPELARSPSITALRAFGFPAEAASAIASITYASPLRRISPGYRAWKPVNNFLGNNWSLISTSPDA